MNTNDELANRLGVLARERNVQITTAESCTGGGIAQAITDISGSSQWFSHGMVTYSNQAKQQLLGVEEVLFDTDGAVSQAVVEAMAVGALSVANADLAVSVSGVAGPDGGSPEKPVGTVWIAWLYRGYPIQSQVFLFSGNRKSVRNQSVKEGLLGLIRILQKNTV